MKTANNRVLVIGADRNRWKDRMVTSSGLELFLAPTSDVKTFDIKYWGYVVAVPDKLNGYRKNDTAVRIKPGDFVYFNYKTMMRAPMLRLSAEELEMNRVKTICKHCGKEIEYSSRDSLWVHTRDGILSGDNGYYCYDGKRPHSPVAEPEDITPVWECDYADIFCRVDDKGDIHAIGDWVLLKKIEHTEQLGSGLLINPFSEVKKGIAVVATISEGVSLNTADGPLAVGDTVMFTHDQGAFENEINGQTYWCCPADIIHAKV